MTQETKGEPVEGGGRREGTSKVSSKKTQRETIAKEFGERWWYTELGREKAKRRIDGGCNRDAKGKWHGAGSRARG